MRKFRFSVIYIENNKLKHKQISSWSAECACMDFEELYPNVEVIEAGLGSINMEWWKTVKANEKEIISRYNSHKGENKWIKNIK